MTEVPDDFTSFVLERQQALGRMAYMLTGDHHAAEDLVQVALARTYNAWQRIRNKKAIEAYVRRTIINEYTAWWRRAWRYRERLTGELPESPAAESDPSVRTEVWQAIQALSRRQRAVIVLRYYEDLTEIQTAELLGVSVGTVKSQTARALNRLRARLTSDPAVALAPGEEFCS